MAYGTILALCANITLEADDLPEVDLYDIAWSRQLRDSSPYTVERDGDDVRITYVVPFEEVAPQPSAGQVIDIGSQMLSECYDAGISHSLCRMTKFVEVLDAEEHRYRVWANMPQDGATDNRPLPTGDGYAYDAGREIL